MFVDEFCDYVSTYLPDNPDYIFIGDFNLHVSDDQDTDSAIFNDSIDAMGLYQHVQFQTHRSGNILDLLLSDITQSTGLLTVAPGPYISDHQAVIAILNIKKVCPKAEVWEIRKLHKVTKDEWNNTINVDNLTLSGNLEEMVESLNKELVRKQDEPAPLKKCTISLRPKKSWYDQEIKELKCIMRKHEQKWIKYKLDSCWQAYKVARNSYYAKLNIKKQDVLRSSIENCSKDSCKLHALITNLTINRPENQWPKHKSKQDLADGFTQYFQNKTLLIGECFKGIAPNQPQEANVPKLDKFAPMSEGEVYKVINSLKSKSCELDFIPMDSFKTLLLHLSLR